MTLKTNNTVYNMFMYTKRYEMFSTADDAKLEQ